MKKYILILVILINSIIVNSQVSLNTIKSWFETGDKPTQTQFWTAWDYTYNTVSDGIFDLSGGTSISVSPYSSSAVNVFYSGATEPTDTNNILNYNGKLRASKMYIGMSEITFDASMWVDGASIIYPVTITDALSLGQSTVEPGYIFDVDGDIYLRDNIMMDTNSIIYFGDDNEVNLDRLAGELYFTDSVAGTYTLSQLASSASSFWSRSGNILTPYLSTDTIKIPSTNMLWVSSSTDTSKWARFDTTINLYGDLKIRDELSIYDIDIYRSSDELYLSDRYGTYSLDELATTYTFNNGLTGATTIQLGGSLVQNTDINLAGYSFRLINGGSSPYIIMQPSTNIIQTSSNYFYAIANTVALGQSGSRFYYNGGEMQIENNGLTSKALTYTNDESSSIIGIPSAVPDIRSVDLYLKNGFDTDTLFFGTAETLYLTSDGDDSLIINLNSIKASLYEDSNDNSSLSIESIKLEAIDTTEEILGKMYLDEDDSLLYYYNGNEFTNLTQLSGYDSTWSNITVDSFKLGNTWYYESRINISSSNFLNGDSIQIVAAPGANKVVIPTQLIFYYNYGTSQYNSSGVDAVIRTYRYDGVNYENIYDIDDGYTFTNVNDLVVFSTGDGAQYSIGTITQLRGILMNSPYWIQLPTCTGGDGTAVLVMQYKKIEFN